VKSQFIVILELVVVLNKGIYGKKIINVCCNLKRGLNLGTKRKTKRGYIKGRREYDLFICCRLPANISDICNSSQFRQKIHRNFRTYIF